MRRQTLNKIQQLRDAFHIYDLTTGKEEDQSAFDLYKRSKTCLEEGSFHLRKWRSNSEALMEMTKADWLKTENPGPNLRQESRETLEDDQFFAKMEVGGLEELNPNDETKILGLPWNCAEDTFVFKLDKIVQSAENLSPMKRNVLSVASRLFDPLGICGPIFVRVKILLQDICRGKHDWDTPLPKHLELTWKKWLNDLKTVSYIVIPRCIYSNVKVNVLCKSLHCFGDSSSKAYCANVYVVLFVVTYVCLHRNQVMRH